MIPPAQLANVQPVRFSEVPASSEPKTQTDGRGFGDILEKAVGAVDSSLKGADASTLDFLQGKTGIHELSMSLEKADLHLRLFTRVRNRIIEAYQEVSRMNI